MLFCATVAGTGCYELPQFSRAEGCSGSAGATNFTRKSPFFLIYHSCFGNFFFINDNVQCIFF